MKRCLFFIWFICLPLIINADPIIIKTIQSYIETLSLGKSYHKDATVIFEVDTLERSLTIRNVADKQSYKMTNIYPTINRDNVTIIKFDVEVTKSIYKKYVIYIPKPLTGKKISVKETMVTSTREMPTITYLTSVYSADGYDTKYISKYFHDNKESLLMLSHKCSISYGDKFVMIGDLEGSSEMYMLTIVSVEESTTKHEKTFHCKGPDGDYLFVVVEPKNKYSTPIFKLTRLVGKQPVVTTEYFGDIIE